MTMKIALEKLGKIEESVVQTRINVAKIEQHLKTLNGSVKKNMEDIEENRKGITSVRNQQIKLATTIGVIVALLTVGANWLFGMMVK